MVLSFYFIPWCTIGNDLGFLQERIDAGDFPSAVYLVAEKGDIVLHDALGRVVEPERIEARPTRSTISQA